MTRIIIVAVVIVIFVLIGWFFVSESNRKQDLLFDQQRVSDTITITEALENYYTLYGNYPKTLTALTEKGDLEELPNDPKTQKEYEYTNLSATSYQFCIRFALPADAVDSLSKVITNHPAGVYCIKNQKEVLANDFEQILFTDPKRTSNGKLIDTPKTIGSSDPIVRVYMFGDLTTDYTRAFFNTTFDNLVKKHGHDTQFMFRYYPFLVEPYQLKEDERGVKAALVAECSAKQGQFWANLKPIMNNIGKLEDLNYLVDVDLDQLKNCLTSQDTKLAIQTSIIDAKYFGLNSVPSFIIQNTKYPQEPSIKIQGAQDFIVFDQAIIQMKKINATGKSL